MIRLAITNNMAKSLKNHFLQYGLIEQGAFCLVHKGRGHNGERLTVSGIILPSVQAWEIQSEYNLRPSAQWISSAISQAIRERAGLLFVHSHPNKNFPLGFSPSDKIAFDSLACTIAPILDGPFGAVVAHPNGWSGVLWAGNNTISVGRIAAIGRTLRFLSPLPSTSRNPLDDRQSDALGVVHNRLRNLCVAVVGCGGLGSPIAEQLVRMGVNELIIIDNDLLDTPSNIRRVFGSKSSDLKAKPPLSKVDVVGGYLRGLELGVKICQVKGDVRTERVFRHLLDADIVLMGTDTHGSRAIVNELPSKYLTPVIDVGVRVGAKNDNRLSNLVADIRILTPETPCLWCRNAISADTVRAENLSPREHSQLVREGYVVHGIGEPEPSVTALTVLGSGLATCALLAALADEGEVAPSGYWIDGLFGDSRETEPKQPKMDCRCRMNIGYGDDMSPPFIEGS